MTVISAVELEQVFSIQTYFGMRRTNNNIGCSEPTIQCVRRKCSMGAVRWKPGAVQCYGITVRHAWRFVSVACSRARVRVRVCIRASLLLAFIRWLIISFVRVRISVSLVCGGCVHARACVRA